MLQYVPAAWIRVGSNAGLKGPAYVASLTRQGTEYIVTGGEDPQAIFVTGDMRGKTYRLHDIAEPNVITIENIEIEVDMTSILPRMGGGYPICCLAMTEEGPHIFAAMPSRYSFDDTFAWNLTTGAAKEYFDGRAVFARWRICRRDGDRLIEILAVAIDSLTT